MGKPRTFGGQAGRVPRHPEVKAGQPQKALPALVPRRAVLRSIGREQTGHAGGGASAVLVETCACGASSEVPAPAPALTRLWRSRRMTMETIAAAAKRSGMTYW